MSAIDGIFHRDGQKVKEDTIKTMNRHLSHRGPDGSGHWIDGPVAMGQLMLRNTPESVNEKLPLQLDHLVIIADARIDNRPELAEKLNLEDTEEVPDSLFILKAYQKWGLYCPEKLLGDFSFAIWDEKEDRFFCARDPMGVKPLYYYLSDDLFVFATELKGILPIKEVPKLLNKTKVADYLLSNFEDRRMTFYQRISRLPAAHSLLVAADQVKEREYWKLDPTVEINLGSDEEYFKEFKNLFKQAVRCRMRTNSPIGAMLSGGLDSSSIVCTARKLLTKEDVKPLKTFSAIFDDPISSNEMFFLEKVFKDGNLDSYIIRADQIGPLSGLDLSWFQDEPFYSPNLFVHWNIYKKAHEKGIRIILDGFDGDSTVSHGDKIFFDLLQDRKFGICTRESLILLNQVINGNREQFTRHLMGTLPVTWRKSLFRRNSPQMEELIKKDFLEEFRNHDSNRCSLNRVTKSRQQHYRILNSGVLQFILETLDRTASAFAIEPRYPFFDRRLIEFCLALPVEQKYRYGFDRFILRQAMDRVLPSIIQWNPQKVSMGANFRSNLLKFERYPMEKEFYNDSNLINEMINLEVVDSCYSEYKTGEDLKKAFNLWKILTLSLWLKNWSFN